MPYESEVNKPVYMPLTASVRLIHILLEVLWVLFIILTKQISSSHTFFIQLTRGILPSQLM